MYNSLNKFLNKIILFSSKVHHNLFFQIQNSSANQNPRNPQNSQNNNNNYASHQEKLTRQHSQILQQRVLHQKFQKFKRKSQSKIFGKSVRLEKYQSLGGASRK